MYRKLKDGSLTQRQENVAMTQSKKGITSMIYYGRKFSTAEMLCSIKPHYLGSRLKWNPLLTVELEVEEEPIVEQEEITDHQNSQPEETSEDESRAADESPEATPIPITGLRRCNSRQTGARVVQ